MAGNTMATIEPRLMHLLNGNDARSHLPSIHSTLGAPKYHHDSRLLLPPLELGASEHGSVRTSTQLQPQQSRQPQQTTNLTSISGSPFLSDVGGDPAGTWPTRSLHTAFREGGGAGSSSADHGSLHGGRLEDSSAIASAASASVIGKRPRVLPHADELIQLPQPLKKQKSSQQVGSHGQVFPPIINGLHEPPPNAAVFPPIASAEFDNEDMLKRGLLPSDFSSGTTPATCGVSCGNADDQKRSGGFHLFGGNLAETAAPSTALKLVMLPSRRLRAAESVSSLTSSTAARKSSKKPVTPGPPQSPDAPETAATSTASLKPAKRASKPRRRWTEEETNQLLIGVSRYGLGKWTAILEDQEFSFSNRTAGDLKDRFRTCCPDELRGNSSNPGLPVSSSPNASKRSSSTSALRCLEPKTSLSLERILVESDEQPQGPGQDADTSSDLPKKRKRRVHRKNMEDMMKLGIRGPFKKSHRRERRPFTEQDDREILEGLQMYGPAWTKIHRHDKFNLASRQPTDLRDRVRNKYPEIYANIEKGVFQAHPDTTCRKNSDSATGFDSSSNETGSIPNMLNPLLEPYASTSFENPFPATITSGSGVPGSGTSHPGTSSSATGPPPFLPQSSSREDLGWRPPFSSLPVQSEQPVELHGSSVYDLGEPNSTSFLGNLGEMGISRLLLDDPQIPPYSL